jgi:signal transduction histidine kinase
MSEPDFLYHQDGPVKDKPFDYIEEKGRKLHVALMYLIGGYSILYVILNFAFGQMTQALITACIFPAVIISWLLYVKGHYYYSKIWNGLQINTCVFILALTTGPETYVSVFFIPIIIGTLVTLQGKEKISGYMLSLLSLTLMTTSLVTDIRILDVTIPSEEAMRFERIANMIGVGVISALEVIYILGTSNDIQNRLLDQSSRLDDRNSQLVAALYTRDKMMSMLSHDLRSPIASIHAGMELFESLSVDAETQAKLITQMKTRTGQTLSLMDKLLLWSRTQNRSIIYREESISIAQIEQFVKSVSYLFANEKQIRFSYDFQPSTEALVRGDRDMVEAIFRNLISNAIKFTYPGGEVSISARENGKNWIFSIKDNGKGMSRMDIEKIMGGVSFSTSGTEEEKGHGLGMQLVQGFIDKHNSRLEIHSEVNHNHLQAPDFRLVQCVGIHRR